jgi:phage terminase large subunit-like protein
MSDDDAPQRTRSTYKPGANVGLFFGPDEDMSLADQVAQMSEEEREKVLAGVDMEELEWDSDFWLRPSQIALANSSVWMTVALAGRGWGKSHVLSIALHNYAMSHPGSRLLLLGRTTSDVRDVMILGSSGIMNIVNPAERPKYNPATRRLTWANGSTALCYSAERPDSLRGIQAHASFCDEVAAYRSNPGTGLANAFDQVKLLTRLTYDETLPDGTVRKHKPQIFVATTPKRVPMILDLVKQAEDEPENVLLVRGPTRANKALSAEYKDQVESMYAGTALGKQELEGELLTDVDGALLNQPTIDDNRFAPPEDNPMWWTSLPHRVIGVDPSVSSAPKDECGIVVVGATGEKKHYKRTSYVIEDGSLLGPPQTWAKEVVRLARKYRAVVVAEKNQGGEMVRMVIQHEDPFVPVVLVHAAVSKEQRAEPVGTAYERGAVRHADWFPELEGQLTSWAPGIGLASPDRLDALVHAVTALLIAPPKEMVGKVTIAGNPAEMSVDVRDHNPAGRYPEDDYLRKRGYLSPLTEDPDAETPKDGKQRVITRARRSRHLRIGQRDIGLGGNGAYTAPTRFRR